MPRKKGMASGLSPVKRLTPGLSPGPSDFELQPSYSLGTGGGVSGYQYPPPRRKAPSPPLQIPVSYGSNADDIDCDPRVTIPTMAPHPLGDEGVSAGDLRYRHKKFKKMAVTSAVEELSCSTPASDTGGESTSSPSETENNKSSTSPVNGISCGSGRYVCPYCKLACAKPSVLQKHIRAHTNERPYPCVPCGFAFKTKSNLYKHCRSRAHALKAYGKDDPSLPGGVPTPSDEDGEEPEGSPLYPTPETPPMVMPQFLNSTPGAAYSPPSTEKQQPSRPTGIYKPKFHTALYEPQEREADLSATSGEQQPQQQPTKRPALSPLCFTPGTPSPEFLQRHISKIISENQAIVETMDPLWPRKFLRQQSAREDTRSPSSDSPQPWMPKKLLRQVSAGPCFPPQENHKEVPPANSRLALALLRPKHGDTPLLTLQGGATVTLEPSKLPQPSPSQSPHQPLNLTVSSHQSNVETHRKRTASDSMPAEQSGMRDLGAHWSQQPHKLVRAMSERGPDKNIHPQNPEGSIIKDLLLKARGGAEVAELPTGEPGPFYEEAVPYTCNMCKLCYRSAETLDMHQRYYCKGGESLAKAPKSPGVRVRSREDASRIAAAVELVALATPPPFPSPGPLLGSTPLVGGYNISKDESPPLKKRRVHSISEDSRPPSTGSLRSLEELSRSPVSHTRPNSLQMFGGKVHINDGSEPKTMIIDPSRGAPNHSSLLSLPSMEEKGGRGGCSSSSSSSSRKSPTNMVVTISRSNLNSGGTIVQKSAAPTSATTAPVTYAMAQSLVPDQQLLAAVARPIVPKITTPSLAPSLHSLTPYIANHMAKLTAYNPLTLPPAPSPAAPASQTLADNSGVVTILHGGREIPYVPGMPGPQSLSDTRPLDLACSPTGPPPPKRHAQAALNPLPTFTKLTSPTTTASSHPGVIRKSQAVTEPTMSPPQPSPIIKVEPEVPSTSAPFSSTSTETSSDSSGKKFLRPTSLPLKPGTFTPKIPSLLSSLPGLPLVSPETPRPRKSYGQLYLNGHAYTYLGLKCSTKVFFCCLNRPQPMYVPQSTDPRLSMYSNWKVCAPSNEPGAELVGSPSNAMALYDSRHRPPGYTVARSRQLPLVILHSSQWKRGPPPKPKSDAEDDKSKDDNSSTSSIKTSGSEGSNTSLGESPPKRVKIFAGGFESNEEYTYVRGRGRGRYVCEECGIRCKKPSMLKKHIRTHTDVRPFTCKHCSFSFKTKGNLTKHMKSKAHYKKCVELGIVPVPTVVDDSYIDEESLAKQQALRTARGDNPESESEEEEDETDDDSEDDEDLQIPEECAASRTEREIACSLLSLSDQHAGLIPICVRPNTYPYTCGPLSSSSSIAHTPTIVGPVSAHSEREKVSRITGLATTGPPASSSSGGSGRILPGDSSRYYFPSRRDHTSPTEPLAQSPDEDVSHASQSTSVSSTPPPMDLSRSSVQPSQPAVVTPHTPVTPVPDSAALLAALCSTVERLPPKLSSVTSEGTAETPMLQAYLTERALQDVRIKQHQVHKWKGGCYLGGGGVVTSTATTPTTPTTPLTPSFWSVQSSMLTPTLTNSPASMSSIAVSPIKQIKTEVVTTASVVACKTSIAATSAPLIASEPAMTLRPSLLNNAEATSRKLIAIGQQHVAAAAAAAAAAGGSPPHSSSPNKPKAEFLPPSSGPSASYASVTEDGKSICVICNKVFSKPSQLRLHVNIHYFERPFRCESCAVSFRTKGHLQKHERSVSHQNKVSMNSTFGMPTTDNPRPFKCEDCKIAFRIHGHLAKHLRSKMHIMKLECLGKLPFGTYAEMERSGINLNEIDTTDCENSLDSLQALAQKMYEKDPSKLQQWDRRRTTSESSEDIDDIGEPYSTAALAQTHLASMAGNASSGEEGAPCPPHASTAHSRLQQPASGSDYEEASDGENDTESTQQVTCPLCSQSFPSLSSLKMHMYVEHDQHAGANEQRPELKPSVSPPGPGPGPQRSPNFEDATVFRCDLCGIHLHSLEAHSKHVASHAQPRPFVCEFCDAGFTSKTLLLSHQALHQAGGISVSNTAVSLK